MDAMVPVLDPSEDFLTVAAAEERMNTVAAQREHELDRIQNELRCMSFRTRVSAVLCVNYSHPSPCTHP